MSQDVTEIINNRKSAHHPATWLRMIIGLSILVAAFLAGCAGASAQPGGGSQNKITQNTLEEQYGMRITLVAVTANGGLIDVRVKVLDAKKASHIMTDTTDIPRLILEKTGAILYASGDKPETRPLEDGMLYYFLYPNSGTVVAEGSPVIVDFGEVQVEPIPAAK
jgi:hypothetical protein